MYTRLVYCCLLGRFSGRPMCCRLERVLRLTDLVPSPYRQFAIAASLAALFFGGLVEGYIHGDEHGSQKYVDQMLSEAKTITRVVVEQGKITTQVVDHYINRVVQVNQTEKDIQDEVPTVLKLDANLMLPASFRLLHDQSATGYVPPSPSGAATSPASAPNPAG